MKFYLIVSSYINDEFSFNDCVERDVQGEPLAFTLKSDAHEYIINNLTNELNYVNGGTDIEYYVIEVNPK